MHSIKAPVSSSSRRAELARDRSSMAKTSARCRYELPWSQIDYMCGHGVPAGHKGLPKRFSDGIRRLDGATGGIVLIQIDGLATETNHR